MNKLKVLAILVTLTAIPRIFSQNSLKGIISYSANINKSVIDYGKLNKNLNDKETSKYLIDMFEKQQPKIYHLYLNKEESYFKKEASLQNEGDRTDLVTQFAGKGEFYFNKKTKQILEQKNFESERYLISIPIVKWHLTKETKQIGKYICYKATTTKKIETRKGPGNRKIIAWYAPQIPLSFGPKEFNGLPGLILELSEGLAIFKVTKINLNPKKKIVIKKPTKGKKVSLLEYHLIERLAAQNFNKYKGSFFNH